MYSGVLQNGKDGTEETVRGLSPDHVSNSSYC